MILTTITLLPRIFFVVLSIIVYLGGRYHFNTLDIPEGLIRPAENPFYHFKGIERVRNYIYVLTIHIMKSLGLDVVGFSHEYGYNCIPSIDSWDDTRLILVGCLFFAMISITLGIIVYVMYQSSKSSTLSYYKHQVLLGVTIIHWFWLITLFPISGVVKVGTFISDRIVVPTTVSVSILMGYLIVHWFTTVIHKLPSKLQPLQGFILGWLLIMSCSKIYNRTNNWMDSISLMESSLETCPNFAKVHMEISKIYSGLYADKLNLSKSRYHLEIAKSIDPELCDIHQQFAHVAIQQGNYLEYEEELTQAVLCPFTMGGAMEMWQRYWNIALQNASPGTSQDAVRQRQMKYSQIIQNAVEEEKRKEEEEAKAERLRAVAAAGK